MKKIALFLVSIISLFLIAGCSKKEEVADIKPEDVTKEIVESIEFPDMVQATPDNIKIRYDLDVENFEAYSVVYAGSGGNVDEVAVIKFSDEKTAKENKKVFEDIINERISIFSGYAPQEAEKLKNAELKVKGSYVFLAVCEEPDKALKIFNDSFKKSNKKG